MFLLSFRSTVTQRRVKSNADQGKHKETILQSILLLLLLSLRQRTLDFTRIVKEKQLGWDCEQLERILIISQFETKFGIKRLPSGGVTCYDRRTMPVSNLSPSEVGGTRPHIIQFVRIICKDGALKWLQSSNWSELIPVIISPGWINFKTPGRRRIILCNSITGSHQPPS